MKGTRPLTDNEVKSVLSSFKGQYENRDKALFLLGVKTGYRISELLSLKVKDVLQFGKILDYVSVSRQYMKKKIEGRTVPVHPEVKSALEIWINELKEDSGFSEDWFLFRSRKGTNQSIKRAQAQRILNKVFSCNHLTGKLGCHSMRKTFAMKVYHHLKGDLLKTQRALGHKNINSTVSYLSFNEKEIDEAILAI